MELHRSYLNACTHIHECFQGSIAFFQKKIPKEIENVLTPKSSGIIARATNKLSVKLITRVTIWSAAKTHTHTHTHTREGHTMVWMHSSSNNNNNNNNNNTAAHQSGRTRQPSPAVQCLRPFCLEMSVISFRFSGLMGVLVVAGSQAISVAITLTGVVSEAIAKRSSHMALIQVRVSFLKKKHNTHHTPHTSTQTNHKNRFFARML